MEATYLKTMEAIASDDVQGLLIAEESYGDSWKKRGGVGAYMMLVRKSDRMELAAKKAGYDIFKAIEKDMRAEGIIDDIRDLRRYLLLVETEMAVGGFTKLGNHRDNAPVVDELNDIADKAAIVGDDYDGEPPLVHLYEQLFDPPPGWAKYAHRVQGGWGWNNNAKGYVDGTEHWPTSRGHVPCPTQVGHIFKSNGRNYKIVEVKGPVNQSGNLWHWEYLGEPINGEPLPQDETASREHV